MFDRIPLEMREFHQWVVWRYEETESGGKPSKFPYSPRFHNLADVNDSATWGTYQQAISAYNTGMYSGIGFVLTKDDPYCFIDLDEPKKPNGQPIPQEEYDTAMRRQMDVYSEFNSFAELSPSGKGLHIIVRASIPSGRKRSYIEIYSDQRYMTMTGNVYRDGPIREYNALANTLHKQMGEGRGAALYYAGIEAAKMTDAEVIEACETAKNSALFIDLFRIGDWQRHGYASQSEADFALIDIIAYFSENAAQTKRIFLQSALGQREKSRANYRIAYMLARCFDHMLPPVDIEGVKIQIEEALAAQKKAKETSLPPPDNLPPHLTTADNYMHLPEPAQMPEGAYTCPPGLLGEIAQFIYAQAPRPVPEIALAGAIGLMAGIVGKAYNVSNTGCNQYTLLLARTGTGKEAIAMGITALMNEVKKTVPCAEEFLGPSEINSSQSLMKHLAFESSCFMSLIGEFGLLLQQITSAHGAGPQTGLRRMMLDLWAKSGGNSELRPMIYSDRDKNTPTIKSPAFSMLGESTPEAYYAGIDESMIAEGFLPRWTVIEYEGDRPDLNEGAELIRPSFDLIQKVATLSANALNLNSQKKVLHVQFDDSARTIFRDFNKSCDRNIKGSDETKRQMWNRAHLKAMKLAALVAIGCNCFNPVITQDAAHWAIKLVSEDVRKTLARFDKGEVGMDNAELQQLNDTVAVFKDYVMRPFSEIENYHVQRHLYDARIVPYAYIQRRLASKAPFRKDKLGAAVAMRRTLETMIQRGDIQEVARATMVKDYGTAAKAFAITNTKAFGL